MNTPHKHADVLRAIADGKEVQFKHRITYAWVEADYVNPITHPELEWRVKPEPKLDLIKYVRTSAIGDGICDWRVVNPPYANLRLTFDGETGKLKAAEVIE